MRARGTFECGRLAALVWLLPAAIASAPCTTASAQLDLATEAACVAAPCRTVRDGGATEAVDSVALEQQPRRAATMVRPRSWYGWQTITADSVSLLLMLSAAGGDSTPIALLGFTGAMLATPLVHFFHGNVWQGVASLSLRVLSTVALVAGIVATVSADGEENAASDRGGALMTVGLVGLVAAPILDAAVFAYDVRAPAAGQAKVGVGPFAELRSGSAGLRCTLAL